jgi:hypothetical protein
LTAQGIRQPLIPVADLPSGLSGHLGRCGLLPGVYVQGSAAGRHVTAADSACSLSPPASPRVWFSTTSVESRPAVPGTPTIIDLEKALTSPELDGPQDAFPGWIN